jgi:hypothetical protein
LLSPIVYPSLVIQLTLLIQIQCDLLEAILKYANTHVQLIQPVYVLAWVCGPKFMFSGDPIVPL